VPPTPAPKNQRRRCAIEDIASTTCGKGIIEKLSTMYIQSSLNGLRLTEGIQFFQLVMELKTSGSSRRMTKQDFIDPCSFFDFIVSN